MLEREQELVGASAAALMFGSQGKGEEKDWWWKVVVALGPPSEATVERAAEQ